MQLSERVRGQAGQAIVLFAAMAVLMLTGVGVAIDAGNAYYWSTSAERAATAAAMSAVVFVPNQVTAAQAIPAGSHNDATDRAQDEARRNRFDIADSADQVQVSVSTVSGHADQVQVAVSRSVSTLFLRAFGISTYSVRRTATAAYLPPVTLGQAGNQVGTTVSQFGTPARPILLQTEGWAVGRENGDPFTPNPAMEFGNPLSPPSTDYHQISGRAGTDTVDASLPSNGGYNYQITLNSPGHIQVYNAAFAPDTNGGKPTNNCENNRQGSPVAAIGPCVTTGAFFGEYWNMDLTKKNQYDAMEYTLFRVPNVLMRSSDVEIDKLTVYPIDASNWNQGSSQYKNENSGGSITQTYNGSGAPTNMLVYHAWMDISTYTGPSDGGIVSRTLTDNTTLQPGTYRLRVDTLNNDGSIPASGSKSQGYKAYAVRAVDASGNPCADCTVSAWNDIDVSTSVTFGAGNSFVMPLVAVPPDYAGQTVTIDLFDVGDMAGNGTVNVSIVDPSGNVATAPAGSTISIYNLGTSRTVGTPTLIANSSTATYQSTASGTTLYNGDWVEIRFPIPSSYSPGSNPSNWFWGMKYVATGTGQTEDTFCAAVGINGHPVRLVTS